ncbi:DUF1566 domain-containing protein [Seleniivibrio woodruffii]|uniref:Lcl domain-containing protein n=1 Tax=Seleniivibrio woodruffii TaxID=1078050 RepID=UPI0026F141FB|nr:DUF1566 domain-containing protein [Seleniivibrio woodruffii]
MKHFILSLFVVLLAAGCGGGSGSKDSDKVSNNAPEISGAPIQFLKAGQSYSFTPAASDADGDELVFSIENQPDWATFDTATGTLAGTPTKGFYRNIKISVSDGYDTTSLDTFEIAAAELLLLKTGQTGCWNSAGTSVTCSDTAQDGETQTGADADFTTNTSDNTVTDNVNGLLWHNEASPTTQPYSTANNLCENSTLASSTWRLPDISELEMTVNYGKSSAPYLYDYFTNYASGSYWTSRESYGTGSIYFWVLNFATAVQNTDIQDNSNYYRCVSGSTPTLGTYTRDSSNGIVYDERTGLEWADQSLVSKTWTEALAYCNSLTYGGYSDWRLPNIKELNSIAYRTNYAPALSSVFQYPANSFFWSSTTYQITKTSAWGVDFTTGKGMTATKTGANYLKCVRGGE